MSSTSTKPAIVVIGGGPAGLMAAEQLSAHGAAVTVYDHMPSVGRKFLMAGRGGLNLTHSESLDALRGRYGDAAAWLIPAIEAFPPAALIAWCEGLGQPTFVGSSGRVFPKALKASPLLRAWLRRLESQGVRFALRHRWGGWNEKGQLRFTDGAGQAVDVDADSTLLALGGASWPRLGSDGGWTEFLRQQGVEVSPLRPANCGFVAPWSAVFSERFAGQPLKPVRLSCNGHSVQGEAMVTQAGLEGGAVYALSRHLRAAIDSKGGAILSVDLRPGLSHDELSVKLQTPRGSQSSATYLRKAVALSPVAIGLIRESLGGAALPTDIPALAKLIKAVEVTLTATSPIVRAISTAGGVSRDAVDTHFMLKQKPGVFVCGEMCDWEAPTGGYLLQASFSTAMAAAAGIKNYLVF